MPDPTDNSTARRAVAMAAGFAAPFIASALARYGINIPTEQIIAVETAIALYIGQSTINAIHARAAANAAPAASTPASAAADLSLGPKEK